MSNEVWYKSKTKWGAILITVSSVTGALGGYLTGTIDGSTLLTTLMTIGGGLGLWGLRDAVSKK
jgi:hypothetical protein